MGSRPHADVRQHVSLGRWLLTVHREEDQQEEQFASQAEVFAAADAVVAQSRAELRCITVIGPTLEAWCATDFREAAYFRKLPPFADVAST